ncbi:MAG: hypothetical protein O7B81_03405, partial [Gammaproteobacteria bacterium]|nr:hypothetical protein [Gammaproteobacteria bacterium]
TAGDSRLLVEAHRTTGLTFFWLGEFVSAREYCEAGISVYDPEHHRANVALYPQDPGVGCLSAGAWALWSLGYPDQALERSHQAIALAEEPLHPFSLGFALTFAVVLQQFRREERTTQERAEELIALSTEQGFAYWLMWGTFLRGWALAAQGRAEEGMAQIRHGLDVARATGAVMGRSHILALLAEAYGKAGQAEEALEAVAEGLAFVDQTGEGHYEAELYRLKGELTLQSQAAGHKSNVEAEAEFCFQKALDVTRQQQAKSWELRAATSLARLWQQKDKQAEAHQLLAEIYNWFTEGFDTKDLQEAKTLLKELE